MHCVRDNFIWITSALVTFVGSVIWKLRECQLEFVLGNCIELYNAHGCIARSIMMHLILQNYRQIRLFTTGGETIIMHSRQCWTRRKLVVVKMECDYYRPLVVKSVIPSVSSVYLLAIFSRSVKTLYKEFMMIKGSINTIAILSANNNVVDLFNEFNNIRKHHGKKTQLKTSLIQQIYSCNIQTVNFLC